MGKENTALQEATARREKAHAAYRKTVEEEATIQGSSIDPLAEGTLLHMLKLEMSGYRQEFKTDQGTFYVYIAKKRDEKK